MVDKKQNIWTPKERNLLETLDTPRKIQDYLDDIKYDPSDGARSPRITIKERKSHCFGGALLAAAALRYHGKPPLILDLECSKGEDEDHVLAIYKQNGYWGAVSKSKFAVIRFRDPVYKNLRELVMTFYEFFFNSKGKKTLRTYSNPIDLTKFDDDWMISENTLDNLEDHLFKIQHHNILTPKNVNAVNKVDQKLLELGFIGVDKGMYSY
ncbi:hypothetical protein HZA97_09220 [Candidatus Woesearchaeota archaeon]|nr:hypothetical protein [Candidatus Woesearchaeota archaeon]